MAEQISWWVELAVKPGRIESFRSLTGEMVEFARSELGVLNYQRSVSDDDRLVHIWERYADCAAAGAHLDHFAAHFGERFSQMVNRKRFLVFGRPSMELKSKLDVFGAVYLKPFGDFRYW